MDNDDGRRRQLVLDDGGTDDARKRKATRSSLQSDDRPIERECGGTTTTTTTSRSPRSRLFKRGLAVPTDTASTAATLVGRGGGRAGTSRSPPSRPVPSPLGVVTASQPFVGRGR